jgi:hypothetical protein
MSNLTNARAVAHEEIRQTNEAAAAKPAQQPTAASPATPLSDDARKLAYQTGIVALGPLVQRVIELEHEVAALRKEQNERSV